MSRLLANLTKSPFLTQVRFRRLKSKKKEVDDVSWAAAMIAQHESRAEPKPTSTEPAKLHMIYLTKTLVHRPYWEKQAAKNLKLEKINDTVVHKNTPEINEMLTTIKHLVRIIPITFPYGLPDSPEDYGHCYLRDNGEFVVQKRLNPLGISPPKPDTVSPDTTKLTLDRETVKRANVLKLNNFNLGREYFHAKYQYKYNQDGKEFRYKGNLNINSDRDWY